MFFQEFPKIIQNSYFKRKPSHKFLSINRPYLLKTPLDECLWCGNTQKKLGGSKPVDLENKIVPQLQLLWWFSKLWITAEARYWQIFWKTWTFNRKHFLLQEMYVTITILEWLVCTWRKFHRNSIRKASQIKWLFESNWKSFS